MGHVGRVRVVRGGRAGRWARNARMRQAASIETLLLTTGDRKYRVAGMYIEFTNVASPGDPVAVPTFSIDDPDAAAYFNGLSASPDTDYLRVPLLGNQVSASDEELYPLGNVVTWFAQTTGVVGVHGKAFGADANSVVTGGALVALVDPADPASDLVYARFYLPQDEQAPKLANGQVSLEWQTEIGN
mgnify:CR=1 FL=1